MMVNDLQNLCIFNSVNSLIFLIVIYQNNLLSSCSQQIPAGDHASVLSILIENREISMTFACHNILNIIDKIPVFKGNQIFCFHKIADRHTLVN